MKRTGSLCTMARHPPRHMDPSDPSPPPCCLLRDPWLPCCRDQLPTGAHVAESENKRSWKGWKAILFSFRGNARVALHPGATRVTPSHCRPSPPSPTLRRRLSRASEACVPARTAAAGLFRRERARFARIWEDARASDSAGGRRLGRRRVVLRSAKWRR